MPAGPSTTTTLPRARGHLVERIGDHAQVALSLVEPAAHAHWRIYFRLTTPVDLRAGS